MDGMWETIQEFVVDYCEYLPESIPELSKSPTSSEFLSDYVLTNLPFVVRCAYLDRFPAVDLWQDRRYLRTMMDKKMVTVAVTPDGRADSIVDNRFMIPEERTMLFDKFLDEFHMPDLCQVYYLQKQNNNLIEEFSPLVRDVVSHVPWATEAFGSLMQQTFGWEIIDLLLQYTKIIMRIFTIQSLVRRGSFFILQFLWVGCHIVVAKRPPVGVVRKFGEGVPAWVSSSSSDCSSKLRGPSQNSPSVASKWDVNITKLNFKIDTGAGVTMIFHMTFQSNWGNKKLQASNKEIFGPDENKLKVLEQFEAI
ncbi:JmjC domain-containing protein 7 [Araneus ventricosus]|uniref:JmjC domain-containing protein 7 n=1 Tax=Araneus ventricosus TaxID=182803 RepID=A0A4Y2BKD9_ARAVE|nr:JmjC domain-containing protein 7 [Araneus ventricosus]